MFPIQRELANEYSDFYDGPSLEVTGSLPGGVTAVTTPPQPTHYSSKDSADNIPNNPGNILISPAIFNRPSLLNVELGLTSGECGADHLISLPPLRTWLRSKLC